MYFFFKFSPCTPIIIFWYPFLLLFLLHLHGSLYIIHYTQYAIHYISYTIHYTSYTIHYTLPTINQAPYTSSSCLTMQAFLVSACLMNRSDKNYKVYVEQAYKTSQDMSPHWVPDINWWRPHHKSIKQKIIECNTGSVSQIWVSLSINHFTFCLNSCNYFYGLCISLFQVMDKR